MCACMHVRVYPCILRQDMHVRAWVGVFAHRCACILAGMHACVCGGGGGCVRARVRACVCVCDVRACVLVTYPHSLV